MSAWPETIVALFVVAASVAGITGIAEALPRVRLRIRRSPTGALADWRPDPGPHPEWVPRVIARSAVRPHAPSWWRH